MKKKQKQQPEQKQSLVDRIFKCQTLRDDDLASLKPHPLRSFSQRSKQFSSLITKQEEIIIYKLKKSNRHCKHYTTEKLKELAQILSNPTQLKEKYLNTDFQRSLKTVLLYNKFFYKKSSYTLTQAQDLDDFSSHEDLNYENTEIENIHNTEDTMSITLDQESILQQGSPTTNPKRYSRSFSHSPRHSLKEELSQISHSNSFIISKGDDVIISEESSAPSTPTRSMLPSLFTPSSSQSPLGSSSFAPPSPLKSDKIVVKLVITEILKTDEEKALRKFLSPILTTFDFQQQFGLFHSALIVGNCYLEWNNSSLIIPRQCYSSAAVLAADLEFGMLSHKLNAEQVMDRLSEIITKWNTKYMYDKRKYNCQKFVDEALSVLGIDLQQFARNSPINLFLTQLRDKGECNLSFPVHMDFREKLQMPQSEIEFVSHEHLDKFVRQLLQAVPDLKNLYPEEYRLLKAFDRAFWLRYFASDSSSISQRHSRQDVDQFKPLVHTHTNNTELLCPFGDPANYQDGSIRISNPKSW